MKEHAKGRIHSLGGQLANIIILEETSEGMKVQYNNLICTAIYNPITSSIYVDDIYGILEEIPFDPPYSN